MKAVKMRGLKNVVTCLLLWLAAFAAYHPSTDYDLVNYDDMRILADHPELYNRASLLDGMKAILFEQYPREEPLLVRDISWAIDSRLFGFRNPRGFHFGNVVLHASVVMLLFLFLLTATRRYDVALLTSVCFLSLAIHAEPVAWVMGRKDLLAACFGFLALMAHSRAVDAESVARKLPFYGGSLVFLTLAVFSKISAVVLPGVLFLLAVFQPCLRGQSVAGKPFPWKRIPPSLLAVTPHLIVSLAACQWYYGVLAQFGVLERGYTAGPLEHMRNLLLINPLVLLRYIQLLCAPRDLSVFHPWPGITMEVTALLVTLSAAVLVLTVVLAAVLLVRRRDLAFYGLSFLVLMIPYLNLRYFGIWVANRYLYFSSFCLVAGMTTLALDGVRRAPRSLGLALVPLVAAFCAYNGFRQAQFLRVWQNDETLWNYHMSLPCAVPDAFYNLASHDYTVGARQSEPAERERWFRKAEAVVARGRAAFGPASNKTPQEIARLLFVEALISIVRNEPPERQLAALQEVERLNPAYDAVLWELTVFHYKQALKQTEDAARQEQARLSFSYFAKYRKAAYRDAGLAVKDRVLRKEFVSDFPFLGREVEQLP